MNYEQLINPDQLVFILQTQILGKRINDTTYLLGPFYFILLMYVLASPP